MWKKITGILLIMGVLLTGTMVFAAETTTGETTKGKISAKLQDLKEKRAEVQPLIKEIRTNRTRLLQLRADARAAYQAAKDKVKELLKNKDDLTPDQTEALKEAIATLKEDKSEMESTLGDIHKEALNLRAARRDRDMAAYEEALHNIIAVQNTRMDHLERAISDMNMIAGM
ncbi:hypothetical protein [Candidatus Formimonas warabiya]|uniref:Uncharacterized protein n=1 Tax=Formimonas warabiya TaxID=1761012 RepID=A0A3G1KVP5_FORW1|nr:hypothetical protein [Candidatus Formimonas warabiya]ATW26603.1 hypothetical protein DCMF_19245 [Candidatus Formimonas warabiya]